MTQQIIVGTGHRPTKLFTSDHYTEKNYQLLVRFFIEIVWPKFIENGLEPSLVVSGMALGFDQAMAESAVLAGYPVHVMIPYKNMEKAWSKNQQTVARYYALLALIQDNGGQISYGYEEYIGNWQLQKRNKDMVDQIPTKADGMILTLSDGTAGGTANCLGYAKTKDLRIINFWSNWMKFREENK